MAVARDGDRARQEDERAARPGGSQANRVMMDRIARPFDATRQEPWAPVVEFLGTVSAGARILDLAGGSGRHSLAAAEHGLQPVVADISGELVRLARSHARGQDAALDAVEADALRLPFRDAAFAHVLFIAGVHCIRGRDARIMALRELDRVLAPKGTALVSVWAAGQDRFRDVVAEQRAALEEGRSQGEEVGDVIVPWSRGVDETVQRFFHVYDEDGLRGELQEAGLELVRIDAVTITKSSAPDNLFATVRASPRRG